MDGTTRIDVLPKKAYKLRLHGVPGVSRAGKGFRVQGFATTSLHNPCTSFNP